jgi:hypothetical protein
MYFFDIIHSDYYPLPNVNLPTISPAKAAMNPEANGVSV